MRSSPIDAANSIGSPAASKTPNNTTQVIHRDDSSLMDFVRDSAIWETNANLLDIPWGSVDAAHDTLVIALEENANQGKSLDGDIECSRREPLPNCRVAHDWRQELRDRKLEARKGSASTRKANRMEGHSHPGRGHSWSSYVPVITLFGWARSQQCGTGSKPALNRTDE